MKIQMESYDVGVIVGRFQVPDLHDAHKDLIQTVCDGHTKVIVFLGLSDIRGTFNNTLPFEPRKQMLLEAFPKLNVLYIKDMKSDKMWSEKLDEMIGDLTSPTESVVLYGSRDSFLESYTGKHATRELQSESYVSGTEMRERAMKVSQPTRDFRHGAFYATGNRWPQAVPTVDIAIWDEHKTKLLLGRKKHEKQFRFIGGFAQPDTLDFEQDAYREVQEECGSINIDKLEYVGSYRIDDWRYGGEVDKIKTIFYQTRMLWGAPRPGDDISEVKWFDAKAIDFKQVVPEHHILLASLIAKNVDLFDPNMLTKTP